MRCPGCGSAVAATTQCASCGAPLPSAATQPVLAVTATARPVLTG